MPEINLLLTFGYFPKLWLQKLNIKIIMYSLNEEMKVNEMKDAVKLTDLEIKIMKVLWEHARSMTIQEIANGLQEEKISVPSVTQAMKKLTQKQAVEVSAHVLAGTVYARAFLPCFTQEEFLAAEFGRLQRNVLGNKRNRFVDMAASLLNNSSSRELRLDEVEELQKLIEDEKRLLIKEAGMKGGK